MATPSIPGHSSPVELPPAELLDLRREELAERLDVFPIRIWARCQADDLEGSVRCVHHLDDCTTTNSLTTAPKRHQLGAAEALGLLEKLSESS